MKLATAVYITRKGEDGLEVLLALKSRVVGIGKRFGYGGKIDEGESAVQCIIRETEEESGGLTIREEHLKPQALIDFYLDDQPFGSPFFRVLFFCCSQHEGYATSTEEMEDPQWFCVTDLPFPQMKAGDELILPKLLAGELLKGWLRFTSDTEEVLAHSIESAVDEDLLLHE